jgi:MFS family permease
MVLDAMTRQLGLDALPRPLRPLALGGAVSAVGSGLWFTTWALYLIGPARLSGAQAGLALTVAGAVGFLAPAPLGRMADRRGPREVYAALLAAEGIAVLGFLVCRSFLAVVVVAALTAACDQGKTGVRAALVTQLAPSEGRVRALAALRSCAHAGDAVGAGLGALVVAIGSTAGYDTAIAVNAATYLGYAVAVRSVPHVPPCAAVARRPLGAVRDLPYVTLAALCGVLTLCWGLLSAGLPLWIVRHTAAPHVLAGVVVLMSSAAISTLQVRFSRGCETPRAAALVALRSGLSLAVSCGLFALAGSAGALAATLLVLVGAVAHMLGELWFVAAAWGLSVPLMPDDRPAEYQGVFATGEALAIMLAPALMTALVVPAGTAGWLVLGVAFAAAGGAANPAARWAMRTRPAATSLS